MAVPLMPVRVALYSPDRARFYDGRTREAEGVGGGISARLSLVEALAAIGHDVSATVHCERPVRHRGVQYTPLDDVRRIDADVFIAISTGGDLSFAALEQLDVRASLRLLWVQGVPKPARLDLVRADYVYVASNFLRDVCAERWKVPPRQLFVCYNGLHEEYFSLAGRDAGRDPFGIAYIGPPEKGLDACIRVLRRLRAIDTRFHLDVFGGGALWGRRDEPTTEPGVRQMGLLGQRDLAEALARYEYCLALQAMEEGFGIAVQEAKRAGVIAIASRVGAFRELIRHGSDGYLVAHPHESPAAIAEAAALVAALSEDPARRERIRHRARATPWSWELAANTWTAHWTHALTRSGHDSEDGHAPATIDLPDGRHALADGRYFPTVYPNSPLPERMGIAPAPQVLIASDYGNGNLGDEAILSVALSELQRVAPDVTPIVASGNPAATARDHDVAVVDVRDLDALERAVTASGLIVLGGGGLFHDYHGVDESTLMTPQHWGLAQCAAFPIFAARAGRPFGIFAAGVGPLRTETGRRYTRLCFERAETSTVRDPQSRDLVAAIGVDVASAGTTAQVVADPAFLLPSAPAEAARRRLEALGVPIGRRLVAVALRHWDVGIDPGDWQAAVASALDRIVQDLDAFIVFVPFQSLAPEAGMSDAAVADRVRGAMQRAESAASLPDQLPPAVVQALFEQCALVVAMRLHAVILGANAGAPVVCLRYDDKVGHAARAVGLDDFVVDLAACSPGLLADRAHAASDAAERLRAGYAARLPARRDSAARAMPALLDVMNDVMHDHTRAPRPASSDWSSLVARAGAARASSRGASLPGASASGLARMLARAVVPQSWRRTMREAWQRRLMSPEAFAFDRFKRERASRYGSDLGGVRAPGEPGLVSVVLPAFNGARLIREAIDSVLAQTYANLELIIVNDGSTDETGAIAEEYAARDARVRVIHQDNQKLPAALTRGFADARGEFLTWTSCDNRWAPSGLEHLAGCLRRQPRWDMVYGDMTIIGEEGRPLERSPHYASYQRPAGAARVALPDSTSELNTRANNFIGAGFLYRSRVRTLLGGYDPRRFVLEDYDYWMRVNALMTMAHADTDAVVCEYRFHRESLTSRWDELGMLPARERLMVFDDFRRDLYLSPMIWILDAVSPDLSDALARRIKAAGHLLWSAGSRLDTLPPLWVPVVRVSESSPGVLYVKQPRPGAELTVLVGGDDTRPSIDQTGPWLSAASAGDAFLAIDIWAKTIHADAIEAWADAAADLRASVVICTNRTGDRLRATIDAVLAQDLPAADYEIIVVDNRQAAGNSGALVDPGHPRVRIVTCPFPGLSAARNAGLGAAHGRYVCYLDDDAVPAREWLSSICAVFDQNESVGIVGGPILLASPEPRPPALARGWETYWSHFAPAGGAPRRVEVWRDFPWGANWAARRSVLAAIGGFRTSFGRRESGFGGGEELVAAAHAQRLGHGVMIVPAAIVRHHVAADRFTFEHVRETLAARHEAAYAATRGVRGVTVSGLLATLARLALTHVDPRVRPLSFWPREFLYRKQAQWRTLRRQWQDLRERRRPPAGQTP